VLSPEEGHALVIWADAAEVWGKASQNFVGASSGLATASRNAADSLDAEPAPLLPDGATRRSLVDDLFQLADVIEDQAQELRDDYLATAAALAKLGTIGESEREDA
jgi:hypothetical protein